jgi:hypothetical protein
LTHHSFSLVLSIVNISYNIVCVKEEEEEE